MEAKDTAMNDVELRELFWASHPCQGKYGDDGELQCNRCFGSGNSIDFKRDSWEMIIRGVARHTHYAVLEARKSGIKEVVEYIGDYTKPFPNQREWKAKLKEWGIE